MHICQRCKPAALAAAAGLLVAAVPLQTDGFDGYIDHPVTHGVELKADSPDWQYFRTRSYCYASVQNDNGVLMIGYDQRRNQGHLAFWNSSVTGYQSADTTYLSMVRFNIVPGVGIGEPNDTWGSHKFMIMINGEGKNVFNTRLDGADMLESISRYDRIVFINDQIKVVQNFSLSGAKRAMGHLRKCLPRSDR